VRAVHRGDSLSVHPVNVPWLITGAEVGEEFGLCGGFDEKFFHPEIRCTGLTEMRVRPAFEIRVIA
jgi:hypothetical protein